MYYEIALDFGKIHWLNYYHPSTICESISSLLYQRSLGEVFFNKKCVMEKMWWMWKFTNFFSKYDIYPKDPISHINVKWNIYN